MSDRMIYLACPYSDDDRQVMRRRFESANQVAALLMKDGRHVFSPISHSHPIAEAGDLPVDWGYWDEYDRRILSICSEMVVLCLPGYRESKGVAAEVAIAREMGIPVNFMAWGTQ